MLNCQMHWGFPMPDYSSFFLNSNGGVVPLECVEVDHPDFIEPFRYVKNDTEGVTVKHESNGDDIHYEYQPMSIQRSTVTNDLDQKLALTIADVEDHLIKSVIGIRDSENWSVKPSVKWRLYRDDDLSAPMISLQTLEVAALSKDATGNCTFDAQAPELNSVKTGETYDIDRFKLLRGM